MSILWRSWAALTAMIAVVLGVLAVLAILQHNGLLAGLIQNRLAVVAQTTAASFRPIVNLGLPISTVRNAGEILERGSALDPAIEAIHVFNPTGIVVHTTAPGSPGQVSREILLARDLGGGPHWHLETANAFNSGYTILNAAGTPVGAVVVVYPKDGFQRQTAEVTRRVATAALVLLVVFSLAALLVLRLRLAGAIHGMRRLQELLQQSGGDVGGDKTPAIAGDRDAGRYGSFGAAIDDLEVKLDQADRQYRDALGELEARLPDAAPEADIQELPQATAVAPVPETSLAGVFTRRLTPWVAGLVLLAVTCLGYFIHRQVEESFAPEIAARTALIGTVANNNIQRAVSSGVPLERLVGAEQFFADLLQNFPEIAYFGVSTGRIIIEAGTRQKSPFSPEHSRKDVPTFPITADGDQIGYIIIDANPGYFALQFRDVLLDLGVVIMVVVLLSLEVMAVMISFSLTGPLNRLHHLAGLQAMGDFSKALGVRGRNTVDLLGQYLSRRAEALNGMFTRITTASAQAGAGGHDPSTDALARRFKLHRGRPQRLQFSYLNDIRLPVFLFGAADELPISFLPVYTRSVENPLHWLDLSLVISLPLAGYLLAIVLGSPIARPLAERFGHRRLLLFAVLPTMVAHLGLYAASTTVEIIAFRTLAGFGYAIATLVCQDYVLDVVTPQARNRSLGMFTAALFAGVFAGTAIGGVLADRLGPSLVFAVSAALVALAGLLIFRMLPTREVTGSGQTPGWKTLLPSIGRTFASPRFTTLVLGIAVPANVILQAFISYLVALQLDALGASAAEIARTLMTYFLAIALIGPVAPRVLERYLHPAQICLIGSLLSGLALCAAAAWPTQLTIFIAVAGAGIGHSLVRDPQVTIAMEIAETELAHLGASIVLGTMRTVERVSSIAGLIALALVTSMFGYAAAIGTAGAWVLLGTLGFAAHALRWRTAKAS